jgi:hypothetical protein
MFSAAATGRVAPIQNFASNNLPASNSGSRERPSWRPDKPQDVRASLKALRKEFPAAAHIDEMARDLQRGMRGRAAPVVRYRPMAEAALSLLVGSTSLVTRLLGASGGTSSVPSTSIRAADAAGFDSRNDAAPLHHAVRPRQPRAAHSLAIDSLFMPPVNSLGSSDSSSTPTPMEHFPMKVRQPRLPNGMLSLQWMDNLDFKRFDAIAFLQSCGETVDDPESLEERLEAFHRCLQPVFSITRSVLGIGGLDGSSLSAFFEQLYPALGLGELPKQGLDPAFAQALMNRWFLSMVPKQRNEDGGNSDFPLNDLLLSLVQATQDVAAHHLERPKMRVDLLRETLEAAFLRGVPARFRPSQKWLVCSLFSLYEPTLMRSDTPPALRYGSLEWTLLDIGIRLAGEQHWQYTHAELVGLAASADVFGAAGERLEDGLHGADIDAVALGSVLRMAHAQNAIDLRYAMADTSIQIAVALFRTEIEARRQTRSVADMLAALPLRSDAARAILKETNLDPNVQFTMVRTGRSGGLLGGQTKYLSCLDFDVAYPLVDFFMADCIDQLLSHAEPGSGAVAYLKDKHELLSHDRLNQRFEMSFDVAVDPFSDGLFSGALKEVVSQMSEGDVQFWREGTAKIGVPEVQILKKSTAFDRRGTIAIPAMIRAKTTSYRATKGLLVDFTLLVQGQPQTRKYWVTLTPVLKVARFESKVTTLLSERLNDFFEIEASHRESVLLTPQHIKFATYINVESHRTELQFVARHLVDPLISRARSEAYQMTDPERARVRLHQTLVELLPLGTCVAAFAGKAARSAQFFCAMDVVTFGPVGVASVNVARGVVRVGSRLTPPQLKKLIGTLAKGGGDAMTRDEAARNVAAVLDVGMPVLDFTRRVANWLNPLDGLASGFSWLGAALGRGSELMLRHMHMLPGMSRITAALKRSNAERKLFYVDDGIWHAAAEAVTVRDGRKYLTLAGKEYSVIDVGGRRNVLALQYGADLRLANPRNGLPYGPPLSADSSPRVDGSRALCRTRRAGGAEAACGSPMHAMQPLDDVDELDTLVTLPQFGKHTYQIEGRPEMRSFYARAKSDGVSVRWEEVDLNFNAFSSEGLVGNKRMKDAPYFAFDSKIWKAVNNRVEQTPIVFPFPDRIEAQVLDLRDSLDALDGNAGTYLTLTMELPPIPGDPNRYSNEFIVPFASYPGFEGAHHGMAQIGNVPYTFRLSGDWMVRPVNGQRILLEKPEALDVDIFIRYQALNALGAPDVFVRGSVRQLKLADNAARRRFDLVLDRAEELLAAADGALITYGSDANAVMARFTPSAWDGARVAKFHASIKETLTQLRSALPMVRRHKYDIVGLGNSKLVKSAGIGKGSVQLFNDAAAFRGSMQLDMSYCHLRFPLIVFDREHFTNSELDRIVSDLIHELSHTRLASRDAMSLTSNVDVYPHYIDGEVDIAPLIAAAAAHNSDSARHASTIEYLVMALGYTGREETRDLLQRFLEGGTRFSYKKDAPVAGDCLDGSCVVSR